MAREREVVVNEGDSGVRMGGGRGQGVRAGGCTARSGADGR